MNNHIRKGSSSSFWEKNQKYILIPKEPFIYHPLQRYHCLLDFKLKINSSIYELSSRKCKELSITDVKHIFFSVLLPLPKGLFINYATQLRN